MPLVYLQLLLKERLSYLELRNEPGQLRKRISRQNKCCQTHVPQMFHFHVQFTGTPSEFCHSYFGQYSHFVYILF